jgi:hypothetical protein
MTVLAEFSDSFPTLGNMLDAIGHRLTPTGDSPPPRDRAYAGVQFYEPLRPAEAYRGCVALCAGLGAEAVSDAAALLHSAGAAAMVIADGVEIGETAGARPFPPLPILAFRDGDWAELATLLRSFLKTPLPARVSGVHLGDLFGLANTVSSLAGGAVSLVDATGQIVGYSTHSDQPIDELRRRTTLLLQEDTPLSQDADYRAVLSSDHPLSFAADSGQYGRVATAVRAADEFLGTVWVVQIDPASSGNTERVLAEVSPIVAEHLLRARERTGDEDRRVSELLRELLEEGKSARSAAAQLLVRPSRGCSVVCFRLNTSDGVAAIRGLRRLRMLVRSLATTLFVEAHSTIVGPHVATLVAGGSAERVRAFAAEVVRTDPALIAGIGASVHTAPEIGRSYREAVETATFLLSRPDGSEHRDAPRLALFDEVRDRLALLQIGDAIRTLEATAGDAAETLLRHDRRQGTDLARTVLTYLDLQCSVRATADALHVHQNTVRYRLDAVRREAGIDLGSAPTRLWLWLRLTTQLDDGLAGTDPAQPSKR